MKRLRQRSVTLLAVVLLASALAAKPATTNAVPASLEMPADIQRLYGAGRYREAVEALQSAVAANSAQAPLHYWLGRSFYELRDFSHSISSFEHAVALDPGRSEYHDWLGRACGRKAEEPNLFTAFSSLALARRTSREFATAVRLDSGNLEAQRDYIRYLLNAPGIVGGSEDHAQEQIQELAKVDPVEGELAAAELLATHKKFDEAGQQYQRILAIKHTRVGVYLEVADYYCDRADASHVDEAAEAAALVSPADARLPYYRGVALVLAKKNPALAGEDLRDYLAAVPDSVDVPPHASAYEWLAKLYDDQGKTNQAIAEYEAALALDPHNKSLREALKRLQKQ
jgi:tetratricopeptide (TPR) repeat protein